MGWGATRPYSVLFSAKVKTIMEKTKSNRGGAREGAGRKATGRTKKTITLCLSYDVVELLNAKSGNKSAYIESLIRADALSE